jgi:hypothetical protein
VITCTVKLRLIKPADPSVSWDDYGARLRELSSIAHRVLNRTIAMLAVRDDAPGVDLPADWRSSGGKVDSYNCAKVALATTNAERVSERRCARCKGSGVEPDVAGTAKRKRAKVERAPGDRCAKCDGAKVTRIGSAVEDVPSAIVAGWARVADRRHGTDRADHLRGDKSLASWRRPAAIAIVAATHPNWSIRRDGQNHVLTFPVATDGRRVTEATFVVSIDGKGRARANGREHMRRLISGTAKLGDLKILAPRDGQKKWLAVASYSYAPAPVEVTAGVASVVRWTERGPALIDGKRARVLHGADDIRRQRAKFSARKASRSAHQRDIAPGARGHGRHRALQHYHAPEEAEARWVRTVVQQVAAKAVARALSSGASRVELDEQSFPEGTLPPAQLREAFAWAQRKAGIEPADKSLTAASAAEEGASQ